MATQYQADPNSWNVTWALSRIVNPLAQKITWAMSGGFTTPQFMSPTSIPWYSQIRNTFASTGLRGQPLNEAARRWALWGAISYWAPVPWSLSWLGQNQTMSAQNKTGISSGTPWNLLSSGQTRSVNMPIAAPINAAISTKPVTRNLVQTQGSTIQSAPWARMFDANPNLREIQQGNVPVAQKWMTLVSDTSALDKNRKVYERNDNTGEMRLVSQSGKRVENIPMQTPEELTSDSVKNATKWLSQSQRDMLMQKIRDAGPDVTARRKAFLDGINDINGVISKSTTTLTNKLPDTPMNVWSENAPLGLDSSLFDATRDEVDRNQVESERDLTDKWLENNRQAEQNLADANAKEQASRAQKEQEAISAREAREVQAWVALMQRQAQAENSKRLRLLGRIRAQLAARWVDLTGLSPEDIIGLSGDMWAELLAGIEEDKMQIAQSIEARKDNMLADLQKRKDAGEITENQLKREAVKIAIDADNQEANINRNYANTVFSLVDRGSTRKEQERATAINNLQQTGASLGLSGQRLAAAISLAAGTGETDPVRLSQVMLALGSSPWNPIFELVQEAKQDAAEELAQKRQFDLDMKVNPVEVRGMTQKEIAEMNNKWRLTIEQMKDQTNRAKIQASNANAQARARASAAKKSSGWASTGLLGKAAWEASLYLANSIARQTWVPWVLQTRWDILNAQKNYPQFDKAFSSTLKQPALYIEQ